MHSETTGFWTPVALSADLPAGTVIPARVEAGAIALWRSQSGHLAASADRCPHRGMSLSHGFVRGEVLSCIYHGWSYGMAGNCLRIPAHPGLTPPETIRVVTHEARDDGGLVWVAEGTPSADPPSLHGFTPLRSLTIEAGRAAIEAALGAKADENGVIETVLGGEDLRLLLAGPSDGRTLLHVLVGSGRDPAALIAVSRGVETLRRGAESAARTGGLS